jgi:hypothetical protein
VVDLAFDQEEQIDFVLVVLLVRGRRLMHLEQEVPVGVDPLEEVVRTSCWVQLVEKWQVLVAEVEVVLQYS